MSHLDASASVAILYSGGLDSAILVAQLAKRHPRVQPIYIRTDVAWAEAEEQAAVGFLATLSLGAIQPLVRLAMPLGDLYQQHWSITGQEAPDAATDDAAVFLPGRNALLLVKAVVWCQIQQVKQLALAPLASNPFDDAQPPFFQLFEQAMWKGYDAQVELHRPFSELHKPEVMRLGRGLPLACTFSCIAPRGGLHCGVCNKCYERKQAFLQAEMVDDTPYAQR